MKRLIALTICIILALGLVGCGCGSKDDATLTDDKRVAITVDGNEVFLDEAKFYAYSAQAANELYYIGNEDSEIKWNDKYEDGTYQGAVKGRVLDDICQRECFYAKKDDYNVKLDEDEKKKIDIEVKNYFEEHKDADNHYDKLQEKIGITEKRLKEVLTKEAIAQKVQDIMEAEKQGSAGEYYKKWLDDASIDCEKCWSNINFQERIYGEKDLDDAAGLTTEAPEETDDNTRLESAE